MTVIKNSEEKEEQSGNLLSSLNNEEEKISLRQLSSLEEQEIRSPVSEKNTSLIAAQAAVISDDPESTFRTVREQGGQGINEDILRGEIQEADNRATREALVNVLSDEELEDEEKRGIAERTLTEDLQTKNPRTILGLEALSKSYPEEGEDTVKLRIKQGEIIDGVVDYQRNRQAVINKMFIERDPSYFDMALNILELMIPFQEQKEVAGTLTTARAKFDSGNMAEAKDAYAQTIWQMGDSREELRNMYQSVPLEDRHRAMQTLVDIIDQNDDILFPDANDIFAISSIQSFIESPSEQRFFDNLDNIISVMDMAIGGGWIGKAINKGIRSVKAFKAAKSARGRAGSKFADEEPPLEGEFIPGGPTRPRGPDEGPIQERVTDAFSEAKDVETAHELRKIETDVLPASIAMTYKETNPDKYRDVYKAIVDDPSDASAEHLYGTSRASAIAYDHIPQIPTGDDWFIHKVFRPQKKVKFVEHPNPKIIEALTRRGGIEYEMDEIARMRAHVTNNLRDVTGMANRGVTVKPLEKGVGIRFRMLLGGEEAGMTSPERAMTKAKFLLRKYGVTDEDLTLYQRQGEEIIPFKEGDPLPDEGEFFVSVDSEYNFSPLDLSDPNRWDVKDRLFGAMDRLPFLTGGFRGETTFSPSRIFLDAHSMLHPNLTLSANVAVDKASGLERLLLDDAMRFVGQYNKMNRVKKAATDQLLMEANANKRAVKETDLKANGFHAAERDAIHAFQEYWDTYYVLENRDFVKTLNARGYKKLEDPVNNTSLLAKPVDRNKLGQNNFDHWIYDPELDKARPIGVEEIDELYNQGGTVAELRDSMPIGNTNVKWTTSKEREGSPYLRTIKDDEQVLNYWEGYYPVFYDSPWFIVERNSLPNNRRIDKAIAVAGSRKEAELYAKEHADKTGRMFGDISESSAEVAIRGPKEKNKKPLGEMDDYWDINRTIGRTRQMRRGKRLEDASTPQVVGADHRFVRSPVDSMVSAARSGGQKFAMRDTIEVVKRKAMVLYEEAFRQADGKVVWPQSPRDVGVEGAMTSKFSSDARKTFQYISSLEELNMNLIDEGVKGAMNVLAEVFSEKGFDNAEKFFRAAEGSSFANPLALSKNTAFMAYLSLGPARQIMLQSSQASMLTTAFPKYVGSQQLLKEFTMTLSRWFKDDSTFKVLQELQVLQPDGTFSKASKFDPDEVIAEFKRFGFPASVDRHNLMGGFLLGMVDEYRTQSRAGALIRGVPQVGKKIGFDVGEITNLLASYLAFRNDALSRGVSLTDRNLEIIAGKARSFSLNMNRAGEMQLNRGSMGLLYQFMQIPHKTATSPMNRTLTHWQAASVPMGSLATWGIPLSLITTGVFGYINPETPVGRVIHEGAAGVLLNTMTEVLTGEKSRIDYSGMSPLDAYGTMDFVTGIFTAKMTDVLANSPAFSLFFGSNPRITNAVKTLGRYTNTIDDFEDPTELEQVYLQFLNISSGFSSAFKARLADRYEKKINTYGVTSDTDVTSGEKFWTLLGFPTIEERKRFLISRSQYETKREYVEDVKNFYKELKLHFTAKGLTPSDIDFQSKVYGEMSAVFGPNERWKAVLDQEIRRDVEKNSDISFVENVMNSVGIKTNDEIVNDIQQLPTGPDFTEEDKQKTLEQFEMMRQAAKDIREMNEEQ